MGLLGDILGFGTNIGSIGLQNQIAKDNLKFQQEAQDWNKESWQKNFDYQQMVTERAYDYNKALQEQIFGREDNAVQRRVEDLKKAGLSPTLAAGSAASAGSAVGVPTSSATQAGHISPVQKDASFAQQLAHVADGIKGVVSALSDIEDYKVKKHNLAYAEDNGLPYGVTPSWASLLGDGLNRFLAGAGFADNFGDFASKSGGVVGNVLRFIKSTASYNKPEKTINFGVPRSSVATQALDDVVEKMSGVLDGVITVPDYDFGPSVEAIIRGTYGKHSYREGVNSNNRYNNYYSFKNSQLERYFR